MAASSWLLVVPAIVLASSRGNAPPERVQLSIATLHAAALTTSRSAGDSTDSPFFLVAVIGPRASSTTMVPEGGQQRVRQDEAIGARPLTELTLASGDSVQILLSVLENAQWQLSGAHWLGSVSLLLTNEGGSVFWRRLDCVASCKVLSGPATTALPATPAPPFAGVVELSGNGGTYHLALRVSRA
ncbi:MAG TPA: hypothetical protein VFT29_16650 [Gemmatimonadaceae bacterium]|nr:hypothetical protein [Gemmatimonadaceae bacterium]